MKFSQVYELVDAERCADGYAAHEFAYVQVAEDHEDVDTGTIDIEVPAFVSDGYRNGSGGVGMKSFLPLS